MKYISFLHNKEAKFGIINNETITDLTGKILGANSLKALIENKVFQKQENMQMKIQEILV